MHEEEAFTVFQILWSTSVSIRIRIFFKSKEYIYSVRVLQRVTAYYTFLSVP